ncbi:MAG: hypothetical protein Kow0089_05540 [Desulfobulbaceae bacterium]
MKPILSQRIKNRLERLGHGFFYAVLLAGGQAGAYLFLYPVVFTYVLCSRRIHEQTIPYLRRRFPDHNRLEFFLDVFKTVLSFGRVLVDRGWMGLRRTAELQGSFPDSERLRNLIGEGRGVVVVLAHVGNWQTCLSRLTDLDARVHSLMEFDPGQVSKHFFQLRGDMPFTIIDARGYLGGMIEATNALQQGDIVLTMGDRLHGGRSTQVPFLGAPLLLPVAPYHLAAMARAPLAILFAAKTGRKTYSLTIADVLHPGRDGADRDSELQRCARRFAAALEKYVEAHPYQWYNFFDIWARQRP